MAVSKPLLFSIFLALTLTKITSNPLSEEVPESSLRIQLDQLKSKISLLEFVINERARESESKDETVKQMGEIVQEKSESVLSLRHKLESLQQEGSLYAKEQVDVTHVSAQLERQVDRLRKEIEAQNKKKDVLEALASEEEQKIHELNLKLENLQRISEEQRTRIRKTEHALQVAEEEMMKAKLEVASISKELKKVRGEWFPHWLAVHLHYCQSYVVTNWNEHGRPALYLTVQKVLKTKAQVETWAEPHIETIKMRWIPVLKEEWVAIVTYFEPHVHSLITQIIEIFHASKSSVVPHIVKLQKMADPFIQEAKKVSKPYINQVALVTKPHIDTARFTLKLYTEIVVQSYGKFIKSTTLYHCQVQEILKTNELTRSLATMELAWFAATALLVLPIIFLFKLFSAFFSKKAKKHNRISHTNHMRRRDKRYHLDK